MTPTSSSSSLYVSYAIAPDETLPLNTFRFSVTTPPGDSRTFTCDLYNGDGTKIWDMVTINGTTPSSPNTFGPFPGTSMSAHLNVQGSGQPDVVVPFAFSADLATALNQQNIAFTWSDSSVPVTQPPRALFELDPQGSPVVLSYDVPEPTSFRGRSVIEFDFPVAYFTPQVSSLASMVAVTISLPPPPVIGLAPVYAGDTPIQSGEVPPTRAPLNDFTDGRIAGAFAVAKATGYFDPAYFPNVQGGNDPFSRAGLMRAVADLTSDTVVAQLNAGNRLAIYRDTSGRFTYRFIPVPQRGIPTLLLVEYYRLSSFPARYGAGRTIKTFSLLPGEKTRIRVSTYRRSETSSRQATSILDSNSEEAESDFERSVLAEQSSQDSTSKSLEYHAEVEAQAKASWGWGSANVTASGGVAGASKAAREEFAKNVSNAVTNNATRASSRRDVQVDTSLDVRVAYFNGYGESRVEVPLPELDDLLNTYIVPAHQDEVRAAITAELGQITDYTGRLNGTLVVTETLGSGQSAVSYLRVDPTVVSTYQPYPGQPPVTVPGVIVAADSHVMRTDGVVVDAFLGLGNAIDDYSIGLQTQAVRASQLDNDRAQAEIDRIQLGISIIQSGDAAKAQLFQDIFPTQPIVNQVEQAVIGTSPVTQGQPAGPAKG